MPDPIDALRTLATVAKTHQSAASRTHEELEDARDAVSDALYAMEDVDEETQVWLLLDELQAIVQHQIQLFEEGETPPSDESVQAIISDVETFVEQQGQR